MKNRNKGCFNVFSEPVDNFSLPEKFTFPFYYDPHPLCIKAAIEVQEYLIHQNIWEHNFGLDNESDGMVIGKMFGVLVVQDKTGQVGYLRAFSGKLAGSNHIPGFVPPVFDMLAKDGFYKKEEEVVNSLNKVIEGMLSDPVRLERILSLKQRQTGLNDSLDTLKAEIKAGKKRRKSVRSTQLNALDNESYKILEEELRQESLKEQYYLKDFGRSVNLELAEINKELSTLNEQLNELKEERKRKSGLLQQKLFDQYYFLNVNQNKKSLAELFNVNDEVKPPAGSGECAAPKLLQYAFMHNLKPLAMAEFWWGASPKSEIRKHGSFYPACKGKCEPILTYMLKGMEVDMNPMLVNPAEGKELEIVFEDDYLVVVNKPAEFLSVPGINIEDSVYTRMLRRYPDATGPLIVHRLDMSTSGLMIVAKSKDIHKKLQSQFIKRTVKKRYVAKLDGVVNQDKGIINLPLRVDLDDRPRQLVCYEHGKPAVTKWEVFHRDAYFTWIHFYPITGRTHQLRVHAAHALGLNTSIVGDDLYGNKNERLLLHAESILFRHPVNKQDVTFSVPSNF